MEDISDLLKAWDYDPQNSILKVIDADGTEKIQVRVDQGAFQGILQMDLDGRPDGRKPHDHEFVLDYSSARPNYAIESTPWGRRDREESKNRTIRLTDDPLSPILDHTVEFSVG